MHIIRKKERYKKLLRKARRAQRLNEPYDQWLGELDRLDELLASQDKNWLAGGHSKFKIKEFSER